MYGTVARLRVNPGGLEKLGNWSPNDGARDSRAVATYAFQVDDDPNLSIRKIQVAKRPCNLCTVDWGNPNDRRLWTNQGKE
jgi:hypothetical protein